MWAPGRGNKAPEGGTAHFNGKVQKLVIVTATERGEEVGLGSGRN